MKRKTVEKTLRFSRGVQKIALVLKHEQTKKSL